MSSRVLLGLLALAVTASPVAAQDWRTVSNQRRVNGEDRLNVHVQYGAGELNIGPASPGLLYRSSLRYDARLFQPINEYDAGALRIGVKGVGRGIKTSIREGGRMDLALSPDVPLDVDLEFGAVEADVELGGLRIAQAAISTGASDTRVRFSRPNPEAMDRLRLEAGAAAFHASGLGNAHAAAVEVSGGVGDITLDFTGEWRADMRVKVHMGVGSLTLRIPRGVGVQVSKDTFLMGFDSQGLVKRGNAYYSTDWDSADHRLIVDIDGAFGSIDVRWAGANDVL